MLQTQYLFVGEGDGMAMAAWMWLEASPKMLGAISPQFLNEEVQPTYLAQ